MDGYMFNAHSLKDRPSTKNKHTNRHNEDNSNNNTTAHNYTPPVTLILHDVFPPHVSSSLSLALTQLHTLDIQDQQEIVRSGFPIFHKR
jgi:hypothetical protein